MALAIQVRCTSRQTIDDEKNEALHCSGSAQTDSLRPHSRPSKCRNPLLIIPPFTVVQSSRSTKPSWRYAIMRRMLLSTAFLLALAAGTAAQGIDGATEPGAMNHGAMNHDEMNRASTAEQSQNPFSKAMMEVNDRMHAAMGEGMTGDADMDFARGMIAHHRGAIDMAKIELEYGKDPELRALAETIIRDQEAEIKQMQAWVDRKGG
ncbi:CopM family metallochaperone [Aurantimonas marianensis]|uniref:DUF305 domain-containing protein n=1 Tax=Aurantimonas marianensis TaxID=2920428 RepID=A0A9X2KF92_9HYPH|nr:DUF305 domain-containing protein [Aurantimonas marianensis]MCP3056183.1 DUF305 domain-containing protein [Aurantimonas marianensis]